jgi:hypothetical protein
MNSPSRDEDPGHPKEMTRHEHDEFNNRNNALWSLYEREVKSRDKVRIQDLKDDMDGVLIFVCIYYLLISGPAGYFAPMLGWFILGCHNCVRRPQDPRFERKSRGPISLLPATIRSDTRSNITTNCVE